MTPKDRFDIKTEEDRLLLAAFAKRRTRIQQFVDDNRLNVTVCPGCGFPTLSEDWFHEICSICDWQHDGQDDPHSNEIWGGPNYELSLTENRLTIEKMLKEQGTPIVEDPSSIFAILERHQQRLNAFDHDAMYEATVDDPIWETWRKARHAVIEDLIQAFPHPTKPPSNP